eukprot:2384208-Lingulodinium_polyedra.AAC.1
MAADIHVDHVARGGRLLVNGMEEDVAAVPYLMAVLARRFEPFAEEVALRSTFDFLNVQRRVGMKPMNYLL